MSFIRITTTDNTDFTDVTTRQQPGIPAETAFARRAKRLRDSHIHHIADTRLLTIVIPAEGIRTSSQVLEYAETETGFVDHPALVEVPC